VTGWKRDEVINRTPFDIGLYVDPGERIALVKRVLAGEIVRNLEIRARMKNGEIRTGSGSASLLVINGERFIVLLVADITDLKRAEEAKQAADRLSRMGRRLIQANEEERQAIARELHDYIDSLAVLSVDLDHLRQAVPEGTGNLSHEIERAKQQVEGLVRDIQTLSERLHSAKLEYLGLEAAAASYCKEVSDRKGVGIDFMSEGIPAVLPSEVSLCLFRVLQEALQNAATHSGSQRLQVLLKADRNELSLTVRDSGVGFDPDKALNGPGLGLTIIKERLKLIDGELSINSQSQHGRTLCARVPLRPSEKPFG
jgi:signal transduction histidine kinase